MFRPIVRTAAIVAAGFVGRAILATASVAADGAANDEAATFVATSPEVLASNDSFPISTWPCWRGPTRNNHAALARRDGALTEPPQHWTAEEGIEWKTPLPGRGHASPCVTEDKVFVAAADELAGSQFVLAIDRRTGEIAWRTEVHRGVLPVINAKNSHASATPACDGNHVYVLFAHGEELSVSALDLDGRIAWQTRIGAYRHANGLGASPALYDGLVIVASDNPADPQVAAIDGREGRIVWRTPRKASDNSATPIVGVVAGRPQLLLNGAWSVSSYDPSTGVPLWWATHETEVCACTMAFDAESVFASGNVPQPLLLAVRADGSGDVTRTHVAWETHKSITYVPSPLRAGRRLFLVTDAGIALCRNAETGEVVWQHRLGGAFSASPAFAGDCIYALNEAGVTYVLRAGDQFAQIAVNELGEECLATPAICGEQIYIRSVSHLFSIRGTSGPIPPVSDIPATPRRSDKDPRSPSR